MWSHNDKYAKEGNKTQSLGHCKIKSRVSEVEVRKMKIGNKGADIRWRKKKAHSTNIYASVTKNLLYLESKAKI